MNCFIVIILTILALSIIQLLIITFNQKNFFFQVLYVFIFDHEDWKKYQRLKKYLKNNIIPFINIKYREDNNYDFAFVRYYDTIFIMRENDVYISSYYSHLVKDLLKRNNHDS